MSEEKETYYSRNRERLLAQSKEYSAKHRDAYRAYWKTYYEQNRAALIEKRREYARNYKKKRAVFYEKPKKEKKEVVKKEKVEKPIVLSCLEEVPRYTMIVQEGNYSVSFE